MKGKFGKTLKVSKYYEADFLQNFLLLFMFLLTIKFVKKNQIENKMFFIFLKLSKKKFEIILIPNFNVSEKIGKAVTMEL